jgi:hypothetical protein
MDESLLGRQGQEIELALTMGRALMRFHFRDAR